MSDAAAIVLAGGRSSRMGSPKAALDWHGSTLLRRVTGIVARSVDGPVIVVSAPGQALPALNGAVEVVTDDREGRGPVQGIAAGLAAIGDRAEIAYVSSTDVPLLHPAFVRAVVGSLDDTVDVVLPEVGGFRQPLSAVYRVDLLGAINDLIAADRMRPAFLFERSRVLHLSEADLLNNRALNLLDPDLRSVSNLNEPADYERAHALPAPEIVVERFGPLASRRPRAGKPHTAGPSERSPTPSTSPSTSTSSPRSTASRSPGPGVATGRGRHGRVHGHRWLTRHRRRWIAVTSLSQSPSTGSVYQCRFTQTSLMCSTGVGAASSVNRSMISAGRPQLGHSSSGSAGIRI